MSQALEDRAGAIIVHSERELSDGFWRVTQTDFTLRDLAGDVRMTRETLHVGQVAVVLPYDPVRDAVVLLRQFRLPAHQVSGLGDLVETAAGIVDGGETPQDAARRELQEETGLTGSTFVALLESLPAAGTLAEHVFYYIAHVDAGAMPERAGLDSESEVIRPFLVPAEAAIEAAFSGAFRNAHALIVLMAFSRHRARLRDEWLP